MVGLIVGAVLLLHWLLLAYWRWRWPAGDKPLPELLVFPRMEIIVATVTVLTMAEVRHRCWNWFSFHLTVLLCCIRNLLQSCAFLLLLHLTLPPLHVPAARLPAFC